MKFAILSDIHGNIFALEECLKYIDNMNIDGIIWCGDYITDVPRAHEVIECIKKSMKKYKTYIVKGNREQYIIDYHNSTNKSWGMDNKNGSFLLTYNELTNEDIDFVSKLPRECVINLPNIPKIFVSHHKEEIDKSKCKYKISGHSHYQEIVEKDKVIYINPGSVGIPVEGNLCANFSILDINKNYSKTEMYKIKYDIDKVMESIKASDLNKTIIRWDEILIKTFEEGENYSLFYVNETIRIAREKNYEEDLDKIPIQIWHEARKNLNLLD